MPDTSESLQEKCKTIDQDSRVQLSAFLSELTSLVVSQLSKLQTDLEQAQDSKIKAEVQKALHGTYSAAAGKKMERWVHHQITKLSQRVEQQDTQIKTTGCTSCGRANSQSDAEGEQHVNEGRVAAPQQSGLCKEHAACQTSLYAASVDCATQTQIIVDQQAAALQPATSPALARSQDSLSLMHHASAAGACTPPIGKATLMQPMQRSPAAGRQPLVSIDTNQQQPGWGSQPMPSKHAHIANAEPAVTVPGPESQGASAKQQRHHGHRLLGSGQTAQTFERAADVQARLASTARRLEAQMLQQTSAHDLATGEALPSDAEAATVAASKQSALEPTLQAGGMRLANYAQELDYTEPISSKARDDHSTAQQHQFSNAMPSDRQDVPAAHAEHSNEARLSTAAAYMLTVHRQAMATKNERLGQGKSQSIVADLAFPGTPCFVAQHPHNSHQGLPRAQATSALEGPMHFRMVLQMQRPADMHELSRPEHSPAAQTWHDMDQLPAGIPLTPQTVHVQPRDSLEASIWKLSSSQARPCMHQTGASVPAEAAPVPEVLGILGKSNREVRQQGVSANLDMLKDELGATLQSLNAKQCHIRR